MERKMYKDSREKKSRKRKRDRSKSPSRNRQEKRYRRSSASPPDRFSRSFSEKSSSSSSSSTCSSNFHGDQRISQNQSDDKFRKRDRKDPSRLRQRSSRADGKNGDDKLRDRKRKDRLSRSRSLDKHNERRNESHRRKSEKHKKSSHNDREYKDYSHQSGSSFESKSDYERESSSYDSSVEQRSPPATPDDFQEGDVQLNDATLKILGENQSDKDSMPIKMHHVLINNWTAILQNGLNKEVIQDLLKKYPLPKNFEAVQPPSINPEVKHLLGESGLKKDKFQIIAQDKLGMSIYIIGLALTTLLNEGGNNQTEIISYLSDVGRMLSDIHYNISMMRRAFITPKVNKIVKDITEELPVDKTLFGENFSARMKAAKEVEKSSKDLIKPNVFNKTGAKSTSKSSKKKDYKLSSNYRGPTKSNYRSQNRVHRDGPWKKGTQPYRRRQ